MKKAPTQKVAAPRQTPSQTVGPFFAYGLVPDQYGYSGGQRFPSLFDGCIADHTAAGEQIELIGRIFDGDGNLVPDAVVEILQADSGGKYAKRGDAAPAAGFRGFGRVGTGTNPQREFRFETVKPGAVGAQAPHLNVIVLMRGMLLHAFTRVYFEGEAANASDPVLSSVPPARRKTLLATREDHPGGRQVYRFDIRMQGPDETVFFDV